MDQSDEQQAVPAAQPIDSATVRWSSVELVRLPRLLSVMDGRPPFERRGLDDVSGFHREAGQPSVGRLNALGSGILDRRRPTWDRCWADRRPACRP
jgi:hypothetical protein